MTFWRGVLRGLSAVFVDHPDCAEDDDDGESSRGGYLSRAEAHALFDDRRPKVSPVEGFPDDKCLCGGHIGWIDRGHQFEGSCYGACAQRMVKDKPVGEVRTIAVVCERLDMIEADNQLLEAQNRHLRTVVDECRLYVAELERDNGRVSSELRQAIAQRDIARMQRDEARAIGSNQNFAP